MSLHPCCFQGFKWGGSPTGRIDKLNDLDVYIAGSNADRAILFIPDVLGWSLPNTRILADAISKEADATVYVPDFFHGETISVEYANAGRWDKIDIAGFMQRNSREIREPEIFDCARTLRKQYKKVGAVGYCYGGWAVFRLGAKEHQPPLVDCISTGHPSLLEKKDIDEVAVPVQVLAPENDIAYSPEMKSYTFETVMKLGVPFDYQHFQGAEHACFTRGDPNKPGERASFVRGKNAAVWWFTQYLQGGSEV